MLLLRCAARVAGGRACLVRAGSVQAQRRALHVLAAVGARGRRDTGKKLELPKPSPEAVGMGWEFVLKIYMID